MSTATTRQTAKITVVGGPDKGMAFRLTDELIHVGRAENSHVALTDLSVAEHHLSIVFRNGRYAIYTPIEHSVAVDDSVIPHARWVWLPATARIRVGEKTVLHFSESGEGAGRASSRGKENGDSVVAEPPAGKKEPGAAGATGSAPAPARKKGKKEGTVARFITDRGGEAMVTLGEDGHLPELKIAEGPNLAAKREKSRGTNPLVVYGLVVMSFVLTLVLLLIDTEGGGGGSTKGKAQARIAIREFYGLDKAKIQHWQQWLRDAQLANSRGDRDAERRAYRRVLGQLNAEDNRSDNKRFTSMTGTPETDEKLRQLIATLLAN